MAGRSYWLGGVAITAGFTVAEAQGHTAAHLRVLGDAAGSGLVGALFATVVTVRVVGSRDGVLRLLNMAFEIRVPVHEIVKVDAGAGLQVLVGDGRSFGSSAFGNSDIGIVLGYRRAHRAVERYERWRASLGPYQVPRRA